MRDGEGLQDRSSQWLPSCATPLRDTRAVPWVCLPHRGVQAEAGAVRLQWRVLQGWLGGIWVSPVATALRCQAQVSVLECCAAQQPDGRGWEVCQSPNSHQSGLMTQFSFW